MQRTMPYELLYRIGRTPWDTGVTPRQVGSFLDQKHVRELGPFVSGGDFPASRLWEPEGNEHEVLDVAIEGGYSAFLTHRASGPVET